MLRRTTVEKYLRETYPAPIWDVDDSGDGRSVLAKMVFIGPNGSHEYVRCERTFHNWPIDRKSIDYSVTGMMQDLAKKMVEWRG